MLNTYILDLTGLEESYAEKVNMLHQERAERLEVYKMQADRVRCLGAGLLLEKGLEDYLQRQNCEMAKDSQGRNIIHYAYGPQGKPMLKEYPHIHFSLSHSGKMAALALSDSEVGIDVQQNRGYNEKIAKRFYHEEEVAMLDDIAELEEKERLFYEIWTCKEAYIKYTGLGMRQDLRSFYRNDTDKMIYSGMEKEANYHMIPLEKKDYFCAVAFGGKKKKIGNIIKLSI